MSFLLTVNSLSALQPVELAYSYNTEEHLKGSPVVYSNQLAYNNYVALENLQDLAVSKKNALFLTNTIPLTSVLENSLQDVSIGKIPGTIFLQTLSGEDIQNDSDTLSVQLSSSNKAKITIVPIDGNTVELYTIDGTQLVVDFGYPYTVRATNIVLSPEEQYRKRFFIEYRNGLITFQALTQDGLRYISYGIDKILRAVGVMLNDKIINPYIFVPIEVTPSQLTTGFDPTSNEVKYFNDLESFQNRTTVDIKEKTEAETSLLISCATTDIVKSDKATVNIAMLKTNYMSTGSYNPISQ